MKASRSWLAEILANLEPCRVHPCEASRLRRVARISVSATLSASRVSGLGGLGGRVAEAVLDHLGGANPDGEPDRVMAAVRAMAMAGIDAPAQVAPGR